MATQRDTEIAPNVQNEAILLELKEVSGNLEKQRVYMVKRFEKVDKRVAKVEMMITNANAARPWSEINPVQVFNHLAPPGTEKLQDPDPSIFPDRVRKFWSLQKPKEHSKLVALLKFYNVSNLADWKNYLLDISDDELQEQAPAEPADLENLVAENPILALSCLAEKLGLNFENIRLNMEMADNWKQTHNVRGTKRSLTESHRGVEYPSKQLRKEADDTRKASNEDTVFFSGVPVSPAMFHSEYSGSSIPPTDVWERGSLPDPGEVQDQPDETPLPRPLIKSKKGPRSESSHSSNATNHHNTSVAGGDTKRLVSSPSHSKRTSASGVGRDTERLSSTPSDSKRTHASGVGGDTERFSSTPPLFRGKMREQSSDK